MRSRRRNWLSNSIVAVGLLAALAAVGAEQSVSAPQTLQSVLEALRASGVEVLYSSDLVPSDVLARIPTSAITPMARATSALAAAQLFLKPIGPSRYVVAEAPSTAQVQGASAPTESAAAPTEILEEVSVYASRFSIEGRQVGEPRILMPSAIQRVPGAQDDPVRALRSLPGLATNVSARPYIRGSLTEDVLIRFDDVTLLDPFHLKNFQNLVSAINPSAVARMDVYSGGFPVQYGTRSAGVLDIIPPSANEGFENTATLSLLTVGASFIGHSETLPLEWIATVRRSTADLVLGAFETHAGSPAFADTMGRVRWTVSDRIDWTAGWLLLQDQLELQKPGDGQTSNARYRDEYAWLTLRSRISDRWSGRTSVAFTTSRRSREGTVDKPEVVSGSVAEESESDVVSLESHWVLNTGGQPMIGLGAGVSSSDARYEYQRQMQLPEEIAKAFSRATTDDFNATASPSSVTYFAYASLRHRWSRAEAEFGARFDGQDFAPGSFSGQFSPRINLRYDISKLWRMYGSIGRFSQAQRVDELRAEEGQQAPDPAMSAVHSIAGVSFSGVADSLLTLELYDKRWTTSKPYFDNLLDPAMLVPDLGPDRVRISPSSTEARGMELSMRTRMTEAIDASATLVLSRVSDTLSGSEVVRSWDQPVALTAGLSWSGDHGNLSVLGGWHQGWPRTPVTTSSEPLPAGSVVVGRRNSQLWGDFWTLDLRASWQHRLAAGDLSYFAEVTNSTNRSNNCCTHIETPGASGPPELEVTDWLPLLVNVGITFRWGSNIR